MARAKVKTVKSFDPERPTILAVEWKDGVESEYDFAPSTPEITAQATHHGFGQKFMDVHSGAGEKGVAFCRQLTEDLFNQVVNLAIWNAKRESKSTPTWLFEAIVEVFECESVESARDMYAALDEDTQKEVRADPQILEWKAKQDLAAAKAALKESSKERKVAGLFSAQA